MDETLTKPFTAAEMDAIRRRARQEEGDDTEARVTRGFWQALKRVAGNLPFAEDLVAAFYCAKDPATPRRVKLTLLGALAYFMLPSDVVPDFLPLLGFTDDAAILAAAIAAVAGSITDEHRRQAREALSGEGRARATQQA